MPPLSQFVDWVMGIFAALLLGIVGLFTYIWQNDRNRLSEMEDKMSNAVTKQEVQTIVNEVERRFGYEHGRIETIISKEVTKLQNDIHQSHNSLQQSIGDIFKILTSSYEGSDRRKKG